VIRVARALAAVAAAGVLAACAELEFLRPAQRVEFELSGRIAVRYRDEASTANLLWRHAEDGDELVLSTALGQGVARIVRDRAETVLTTADGQTYRAPDAETLTEQVLGFRLPLAGLAHWVRARPAEGPHRERRDAQGRLLELEQDGWRVDYLAYGEADAADAGDRGRPRRLRLRYPALELRLAIAEWRNAR